MSVERKKGPTHSERVEKRLETVGEVLKDKKVWAIALGSIATAGLILTLRHHLKEETDKDFKPLLDEITQDTEESSESTSKTLGEMAILVEAEGVAQKLKALEKTKGGKRLLRWFGKVCRALGAPPGTKTVEEQITFAATVAGEHIIKPELEEKTQEKSPTKQSELQGSQPESKKNTLKYNT